MPYLSASAVVIHYEEALYQVYAPLQLQTQASQHHDRRLQLTSGGSRNVRGGGSNRGAMEVDGGTVDY